MHTTIEKTKWSKKTNKTPSMWLLEKDKEVIVGNLPFRSCKIYPNKEDIEVCNMFQDTCKQHMLKQTVARTVEGGSQFGRRWDCPVTWKKRALRDSKAKAEKLRARFASIFTAECIFWNIQHFTVITAILIDWNTEWF